MGVSHTFGVAFTGEIRRLIARAYLLTSYTYSLDLMNVRAHTLNVSMPQKHHHFPLGIVKQTAVL